MIHNKESARIKYIQGLRGMAISMIFIAHTGTFLTLNIDTAHALSTFGGLGVYIFIVISGVLLSFNSYPLKQNENASLLGITGSYVKRKVKKLYWLHFLMWVWVLTMIIARNEFSIRYLVYSFFNLTLTQAWVPFSGIINSFNGPSWYLSMMLFVWILTPTFMKWVKRIPDKAGPLLLAAISLIVVRSIWLLVANVIINYIDVTYDQINVDWFADWATYFCPLLCFGTYAYSYFVCKFMNTVKTKNSIIIFVIAVAGLILVCFLRVQQLSSWIIIFSSIIVSVLVKYSNDIFGIVFGNKLFCILGELSSYIFLVHGPVNFLIRDWFNWIAVPYKFFVSMIMTLLISYILKNLYKIWTDKSKKAIA